MTTLWIDISPSSSASESTISSIRSSKRLRRQMSDEDLRVVHARLVEEGEATMREADALEKFGQRKFGVNDNSSS